MSKQRKRIVPNVVRGGTAIPIGDNLFYMQGRKHEQGGIDIGDNAKTGLEVEGGEVVQTSPKSIKVFSSVPFLYGGSPANLVISGADPNKVFNAQERFKDKNNINDDGTKKKRNGGDKSFVNKATDWLESIIGEDAIKRIGYNISKDSNVATRGKANAFNIIRRGIQGYINRNKEIPLNQIDDNKYGYFFGMDNLRPRIEDNLGFDYTNYINKYYPDKAKDIHSYEGIIFPNGEVPTDYRNKGLLEELAKQNKHIYLNNDDNFIDYIQEANPDTINYILSGISDVGFIETPYKDDVHNYITKVRQTKDGNYVLDMSDLYDFEPNHYSNQFNGKWQAELMSKYGTPYILRQNNVPVKFIDLKENIDAKSVIPYNGGDERFYMTDEEKIANNIQQQIDRQLKDGTISNLLGYGQIEPSVVTNRFGGMKQHKNGGLSRNKDYNSSKKPYPSVKSSDFAGGNRSYPIPTKADAVDALRLAGLHGRSDVKAKVYRKYPELRKKKPFGGGAFYDIANKGFQRYIDRTPIGILQTTPLDGSNFSLQFKPITIDIPTMPTINYDLLNYTPTTQTKNETDIPVVQTRNFEENFGLPEITHSENLIGRAIAPVGELAESKYPVSTYKNKRYNSNVVPAVLDSVGSLIDIGGNITSNILNRNMLNDLEYVDAPIPLLPTKLKTRININPQLQRLYSNLALMENAVNNNTTSSRTALARNQRLRNQVRQASNELYGNKENIETQLINRDRLNQQNVAAQNLRDYNQWRRGKSEFDNQIREALAENNVALTQGIGKSLNTLIQNLQQRNLEAKNLAYLSMSNPYAVDALNSRDFINLYRMYGGFRCGGKKKVNRR